MTSSPKRQDAVPQGWFIPLAVALLVALGTAGGTYTLWSDHDTPAQLISTGDLKVHGLADPSWQDTSPDVPGTPRVIDPATFVVRPGDTLAVTIPFQTTVRGENMRTELTVDWSDDDAVPPGVTGTFRLVDHQGRAHDNASMDLGRAIDFSARDGGQYTVEVDLDFADVPNRIGAEAADPLSELGTFDVEIAQVRPKGGAS